MILIIRDTREQKPLSFDHIKGVVVEDMCLNYGDYSACIGKDKDSLRPVPVHFCRKGKGDLFSTMASGDNYKRFKAEMARAKEKSHKLILIIEGTYQDILDGYGYSQFTGESMIKKLSTLHVKYDLDYWFTANRREMACRIYDTYSAIERHWAKGDSGKEGK